ncbi:glycoside hydrolase family 43 protein [Bariatricus massiliensis]|uniref:Glycoside hydrolase family 43 protein n=1 Tax=Bariatricus massiliensis TaxID=1745713 RepID=A0ABS8DE53_9FIRM|nr:glycoside hydrolase family 43 protein [Bariatricus massiliensis]MCB7302810.1 glycoside hydrolase family 43 protein [Bariatricus massiliensis]MCB7374026.1 glycoside hydrolase family 43 protein [Bariatricus massiliensis]MCB7386696.1 glycoside hydrolase family 43 protein [Bariatricus massiliensis]MCB7410858.1 glycoside hydrolase family 43 protein [Bariatricus massiliensis]MCQ5251682.1 glycoside hydrolase family 43 protein [Bariatricus massiliensis]
MKKVIHNPVLRGFNPDPSILRVGDDYYIATSTFQWFPGVQIYHSKDLVQWEFLGRPLDNKILLDMTGIPDSGGVWAPCLTYDNGLFYLVYSIVRNFRNYYKDVDNYLTTAQDISGPWSAPVYLNSSGFDPSMFHDTDGKKYLVNQLFNHRDKGKQFLGIVLQEYDTVQERLVGAPKRIFGGSRLGITEGPHLYKIDGYYYLICAEGGTFYEHAVTEARTKDIWGPYEICPDNPILTSAGQEDLELQKSGHGSLVETQNGEWYMAHLCARPKDNQKRCMLGRETAIQKLVKTDDGWLKLWAGGRSPQTEVPAPYLKDWNPTPPAKRGAFDGKLADEFQTLREPADVSWMSLNHEKKSLLLTGRQSLESLYCQSLVGRRREDFYFSSDVVLDFEPENFQQMAGIALYYDTSNYIYLNVTWNETKGKCVGLLECDQGVIRQRAESVPVSPQKEIALRINVENSTAVFAWSADKKIFRQIGKAVDVTHLSDDYYEEDTTGLRFTGTFIVLCCQDVSGQRKTAEFSCFEYCGRDRMGKE